jgi:hypothetical protein
MLRFGPRVPVVKVDFGWPRIVGFGSLVDGILMLCGCEGCCSLFGWWPAG